jgi:hypothetical protein
VTADDLPGEPRPVDPEPRPVDPEPRPVDPEPGPVDPEPRPVDPQPVPLAVWPEELWAEGAPTSLAAAARAASGGTPTIDRPASSDAGRPADGRLARVHLRGGLLTLARASLEQLAGVGALDREALVDLAEARWRSGDLEGAAEAAAAHLAAGGDEPFAHLIVAEEADRQGSLVEARRHAAIVRERVGTGLDRLFAGEVRSTAWPLEGIDWMDAGATAPGRWGLLAGGLEVAAPEPSSWRMMPPPTSGSPVSRPLATFATAAGPSTAEQIEIGRAAGAELEVAERELGRGGLVDAVDRLSLVLRFDPALAPVILSLADRALAAAGSQHPGLAALHRLRGDAYRGMGRETEAAEAFRASMRALDARSILKEST